MQRTRPNLVALSAVVTELVLIAALANQASTHAIVRHVGVHQGGTDRALNSALTFAWRFTPYAGEPARRAWGAQFAGIAAFLVLSYLFVWIAARAQATLVQTFVGSALGVFAATVAGVVVRSIVYPYTLGSGGRFAVAVFRAPTGEVTFFAASCGLLVAIVATTVWVSTRATVTEAEPSGYPLPAGPGDQPGYETSPAAYQAAAGYPVAGYPQAPYPGPGYPQPQYQQAGYQQPGYGPEAQTSYGPPPSFEAPRADMPQSFETAPIDAPPPSSEARPAGTPASPAEAPTYAEPDAPNVETGTPAGRVGPQPAATEGAPDSPSAQAEAPVAQAQAATAPAPAQADAADAADAAEGAEGADAAEGAGAEGADAAEGAEGAESAESAEGEPTPDVDTDGPQAGGEAHTATLPPVDDEDGSPPAQQSG